jgi:hypothetical protein
MAYITPVSGGAQPVFATDVRNPVTPGTATAGTPVNEYVSNVIQAIQQTCTVAVYQVDGTQISFGIFPTGAFGNSAANPPTTTDSALFLAAANITYTGYQLNSAASVGFKLATS